MKKIISGPIGLLLIILASLFVFGGGFGWLYHEISCVFSTKQTFVDFREEELSKYFDGHGKAFFQQVKNFKGKKNKERDPIYLCSFAVNDKELYLFLKNNKFLEDENYSSQDLMDINSYLQQAEWDTVVKEKNSFYARNDFLLPATVLLYGKKENDVFQIVLCIVCL